MKTSIPTTLFRRFLLLATFIIPLVLHAETWHAFVGAQTHDKGRQALAFLPMKYGSTPATASPGRLLLTKSIP